MPDDKSKKLTLGAGDAVFYQYDPIFGFWGIPNMERDVRFKGLQDDFIHVRHNNEGNRDKDVTGINDGSILCLGGSHTWGAGVDQDKRYTEYLEEMTGKRVLNLGHCSLGLDQIFLVMLRKSDYYHPSFIIIEQYPWAIHRILNTYVNGYTRPYFFLDANGNLKLQKMPAFSRFKICRQIIGSFYNYRKEFREFKAGINLKDVYDPWTDPIFLFWKIPYYDYMYNLVDRILGGMQDFCRQKGIQLLFGLEPIMQQFGRKSPSSLIDYDLPRNRLMKILEKNRIATIDMAPAMMSEHSIEDPVVFQDGHMNAKGHRIFAQEIFRSMKERQWLRI
ncbi:MAG: hypothetical protein L7F78_14050 [Syntrophales bacterium LBB04]|nr:hypothetical protein [Syntrophales bacterium LBB04]